MNDAMAIGSSLAILLIAGILVLGGLVALFRKK